MRAWSMYKRSGFTLIEIIIVVVILGILAAIALPKLTENIDKAKAAEVFNIGSDFAKALDRCLTDETGGGRSPTTGDLGNCNSFTEVHMSDPTAVSSQFTYAISDSGNIVTLIGAMRSGAAASDLITFTYDIGTGQTTRGCGPGKFSKMCKS